MVLYSIIYFRLSNTDYAVIVDNVSCIVILYYEWAYFLGLGKETRIMTICNNYMQVW